MTLLESAALIFIGYIAVFAIINRICNCIEKCHGVGEKQEEKRDE